MHTVHTYIHVHLSDDAVVNPISLRTEFLFIKSERQKKRTDKQLQLCTRTRTCMYIVYINEKSFFFNININILTN